MIRVENLSCGYPGQMVLTNVSFEIRKGEFVGILGPNGAGKTTLLLALSGIIAPREGSIHVAGRAILEMSPKERARKMAVIAQESEVRFPFSCEEIVRMGRYPHQKKMADRQHRGRSGCQTGIEDYRY